MFSVQTARALASARASLQAYAVFFLIAFAATSLLPNAESFSSRIVAALILLGFGHITGTIGRFKDCFFERASSRPASAPTRTHDTRGLSDNPFLQAALDMVATGAETVRDTATLGQLRRRIANAFHPDKGPREEVDLRTQAIAAANEQLELLREQRGIK